MAEKKSTKQEFEERVKVHALKIAEIEEGRKLYKQSLPTPQLLIRKASEITSEKVSYCFGGRMFRGMFQLMVGPGEAGKGMMSVDIIARLSKGLPFPGDNGKMRTPTNVMVCTTEDTDARVKARLEAADADLDHVFFIDGPTGFRGGLLVNSPVAFDSDAGGLVQLAKDKYVGALFLETMLEHLGDREGMQKWSTNNEAEVRRALAPLVAVCREAGLIGWGVMHPRKSVEGSLDDAISGSAAFRNTARSVLHVVRDPLDLSPNPQRLLMCNKSNHLAARPATLRFRIESWERDPTEGRVVWGIEGRTLEDPRSADEIFEQMRERIKGNKPRRDTQVEEAEQFIRRCLNDGIVTPEDIKSAAQTEDISLRTLRRAKANLGIVSVKDGFPAVVVAWKLPDNDEGTEDEGGDL